MKVLVTGAGGQLGRDVHLHCEAMGDEVVPATHAALDVGDRDAVYQAVLSVRPDVVVHAGAWTAVDACEGDPDRAYRVNALGARWVADASRRAGAHLCYVSTDYVFDGTKDGPYVEWDATGPQSVYGASKRGGELEVAGHAPGSCVVRTSWVCGEHGNNMVKTVLGLADRPELAFVDDQRGCPSFTADLAVAIRSLAASRVPGLFHVTNQGAVSWYEFVRDILAAAGHDPAKVRPIATADLDPPRPAPRPANSVLDNAALRLAGFPLLPHYRDGLAALVKRLQG
ncbi:MAG TPA: dTDP-4-dehydrorhamnose reductase [Acidimicrobiales bacterium]|nr:dTDP-4-dehydrorhamnose reductase [Acidimicrobiales bacterium]